MARKTRNSAGEAGETPGQARSSTASQSQRLRQTHLARSLQGNGRRRPLAKSGQVPEGQRTVRSGYGNQGDESLSPRRSRR